MFVILGIALGLFVLFVVINFLFKQGNHYWIREEDEFFVDRDQKNK